MSSSSSSQRQDASQQGAEVSGDNSVLGQSESGNVTIYNEFSRETQAVFAELVDIAREGLDFASGTVEEISRASDAAIEASENALETAVSASQNALETFAAGARDAIETVVSAVTSTSQQAIERVASRADFQEQPGAVTVQNLTPIFVGGAALIVAAIIVTR